MTIATRPLSPKLGAEVLGVDLEAGVDDATFAAIRRAFLAHQVLLFEAEGLAPGAQVAFARRFGEVQVHVMNQYHADGFPELYRLSNLDGVMKDAVDVKFLDAPLTKAQLDELFKIPPPGS